MKKLIYLIAIAGLLAIIYYSLNSESGNAAYTQKVADVRAERVRYLKNSEQSPFQQSAEKYQPLAYFPIDTKYKVRANLERIQSPTRMAIQNSDGTTTTYSKFAYAVFQIDGQQMRLLILKPSGFGALPNTYFTAFADDTSGSSSYGGGRYLDLDIGKSDNIEIDFNLAYNPYCAYVKDYTCPLPPSENILPVKIEAGEKDYPH
ncbi:DUF1684 domain-containing protein [Marinoscillum sp.]|uniref:DUF1684 domain-containing protein n=1 Tax=Marinoscillum sp. TaxID=2024838 RepID=UPI003BAC217F